MLRLVSSDKWRVLFGRQIATFLRNVLLMLSKSNYSPKVKAEGFSEILATVLLTTKRRFKENLILIRTILNYTIRSFKRFTNFHLQDRYSWEPSEYKLHSQFLLGIPKTFSKEVSQRKLCILSSPFLTPNIMLYYISSCNVWTRPSVIYIRWLPEWNLDRN